MQLHVAGQSIYVMLGLFGTITNSLGSTGSPTLNDPARVLSQAHLCTVLLAALHISWSTTMATWSAAAYSQHPQACTGCTRRHVQGVPGVTRAFGHAATARAQMLTEQCLTTSA